MVSVISLLPLDGRGKILKNADKHSSLASSFVSVSLSGAYCGAYNFILFPLSVTFLALNHICRCKYFCTDSK